MRSRVAPQQRLPPVLWTVTAVESLVLLFVSGALFVAPTFAGEQWPWMLTPFNMRFLGAVYAASFVSVTAMAAFNRWDPGRMVLPMIVAFTVVALIASLLHVDELRFEQWGTWAWFALYVGVPVNGVVHLWLYRNGPAVHAYPLPSPWRASLFVFSAAWSAYGLLLWIAPEWATGFWPWSVDAFHAQVYSAAFLAAATGGFIASRRTSSRELGTFGLTTAVQGLMAIVGLVVVDRALDRVQWDAVGTILWVGLFALTLVVGAALVLLARRRR